MKKLRSVSTSFWSDPFIEELTSSEKLLFIYFITNEKTNMLGIYESSIKKIAFETGIDKSTVEKALKKFEKAQKVKYRDNYIILINFLKHQKYNTNMKKSALEVYSNLPKSIKGEGVKLDLNNPLKAFESLSNHLGMVPKVEEEVEREVKSEIEVKNKEEGEEKKIPPFEEFSNYAFDQEEKLSIEIDQAKLKAKYLSWVENGWKTGKGTKIKNWKSTLLNTINYLKKEKSSAKKEKPTHSQKILGDKFYNELMESLNPNTDDGFTPLKRID